MRIASVVGSGSSGVASSMSWWLRAPELLHTGRTLQSAPRAHAAAGGWTQTGRVHDSRIAEVSGVVASRRTPGALWVHNDSGDGARVFALSPNGTVRGEVSVRGAEARDWEDIAVGPGPAGSPAGQPWIYVADTGDNHLRRDDVQVYRFPEPLATDGGVDAQRIDLRYGDGRPHNTEAMLIDPRSGDLLLITKVDRAGGAQLFRAAAAELATGRATLQPLGVLPTGPLVTGGDVSADGTRVVLRTYEGIYAWQVRPGEPLASALLRASTRFDGPGPDPFEAICFTPDASSWISIPEGENPRVWKQPVPVIPEAGNRPDFW